MGPGPASYWSPGCAAATSRAGSAGRRAGVPPGWTTYVCVDDADETADEVAQRRRKRPGRALRRASGGADGRARRSRRRRRSASGRRASARALARQRAGRVGHEPVTRPIRSGRRRSTASCSDGRPSRSANGARCGASPATSAVSPTSRFTRRGGGHGGRRGRPPRWGADFWIPDIDAAAASAPRARRQSSRSPRHAAAPGRLLADPRGAVFSATQLPRAPDGA